MAKSAMKISPKEKVTMEDVFVSPVMLVEHVPLVIIGCFGIVIAI